jgi:hypothetical protein
MNPSVTAFGRASLPTRLSKKVWAQLDGSRGNTLQFLHTTGIN